MMTWLPLANLTESARAFHDQDLETQVLWAGQGLRALAEGKRTRLTAMWWQYEGGLLSYFLHLCAERQRRGVPSHDYVRRGWQLSQDARFDDRPLMPRWFGYRAVHLSHASRLIALRPAHYARLWPQVPLDMPILWPVNKEGHFDFSIRISGEDRARLLLGELVLNLTPSGPLGKVEL